MFQEKWTFWLADSAKMVRILPLGPLNIYKNSGMSCQNFPPQNLNLVMMVREEKTEDHHQQNSSPEQHEGLNKMSAPWHWNRPDFIFPQSIGML